MSDRKRSVLGQIAFVYNLMAPEEALDRVGILTFKDSADRSGVAISRVGLTTGCFNPTELKNQFEHSQLCWPGGAVGHIVEACGAEPVGVALKQEISEVI
jgi:hypothetical protein